MNLVEAGAGTGKTYTIEHLVVDLLLRTDASLEEILVVTFTEKATTELRRRIRRLIALPPDRSGRPNQLADLRRSC